VKKKSYGATGEAFEDSRGGKRIHAASIAIADFTTDLKLIAQYFNVELELSCQTKVQKAG
jgi:NTP pyrophosphatase (non-canonical NTP hydrolase)